MMVMGRDGKFWAAATPANANVANKAAKTILRICFLQRAISNLMVRSAATPRVSNHEATGLAASFETALRASFGTSAIALIPEMRILEFRVVDRLVAIERARDRRQRIFKPGSAIEQHDAIAFCNTTFGEALLVSGIRCRPFRTQQQALLARHFVERSRNLLIRHRD